MNTYYHVSFEKVNQFIPRVPKHRAIREDGSTPRICVCTSIYNCLLAMPDGGFALKGLLNLAACYNYAPTFYVYSVKEKDVKDLLVTPIELFSKYGVEDALETDEYWITSSVPFTEEKYVITGCDLSDVVQGPWGIDGILFKNLEYAKVDNLQHDTAESLVQKLILSNERFRNCDIREIYKTVAESSLQNLSEKGDST